MVRETEFMALKNDQQLKVDYRGFPEMLYAHLNICQSQKDVQSQ